MYNNRQYPYKYIAGVVSVQVFTGAGLLHAVTVNGQGTAGTVTITDTASPVATVAIISVASPIVTLTYDVTIAGGLQITTSASPNITVTYDTY